MMLKKPLYWHTVTSADVASEVIDLNRPNETEHHRGEDHLDDGRHMLAREWRNGAIG